MLLISPEKSRECSAFRQRLLPRPAAFDTETFMDGMPAIARIQDRRGLSCRETTPLRQ